MTVILNEKRFWSNVDKTSDCWIWVGCKNPHGYGLYAYAQREQRLAHRLAWILTKGPIPKGLCICHHCDIPACVNPDHLFMGTQKDNMADCARKNRLNTSDKRGMKHPGAKFTDDQVRNLRKRYDAGETDKNKLGYEFGVTRQAIHYIINRKNWSHI